MRRDAARWGAAVTVCILAAAFLPAAAGASELIGRNATGVRLQADAQGRALVAFRSEGQAETVLAWGAIDARAPSPTKAQVAFKLRYGGAIGPNTCRPYRGQPLAWRVAACTAPRTERTGASRPGSGCSRTTASRRRRERAAWELRLSHWSRAAAHARDLDGLVVPALPPPLRAADLPRRGVFGFRSTRFGCRSTPTAATSSSTPSAAPTGRVEAREQLPHPQADGRLLLRLLPPRRRTPSATASGTGPP